MKAENKLLELIVRKSLVLYSKEFLKSKIEGARLEWGGGVYVKIASMALSKCWAVKGGKLEASKGRGLCVFSIFLF